MNKALSTFSRRVLVQAKNVKPLRGGGGDHGHHVMYECEHLTKGSHPGRRGVDWGTGYFPVGNKLVVGGGLLTLVFSALLSYL